MNHFEHHPCLTQKDLLFQSMFKHCENQYRDVFDAIPITFVIDTSDKTRVCPELSRFSLYFTTIERNKQHGTPGINQALLSHPNL